MKRVSLLLSSLFICISAEAGPRFLNATFESKILGAFQVSLKVTELALPIEAVPETSANVQRDNGQIVAMNCVTTALFNDVANTGLKISNPKRILLEKSSSVVVQVSNSYEMNDADELCNTSSLIEMRKGHIKLLQPYVEIQLVQNGETYYMSVSVAPFSPLVDVNVSGDENRMSLDWLDIFTGADFQKPTLNYSVYQKSNSSTSFLEHGSATLQLQ